MRDARDAAQSCCGGGPGHIDTRSDLAFLEHRMWTSNPGSSPGRSSPVVQHLVINRGRPPTIEASASTDRINDRVANRPPLISARRRADLPWTHSGPPSPRRAFGPRRAGRDVALAIDHQHVQAAHPAGPRRLDRALDRVPTLRRPGRPAVGHHHHHRVRTGPPVLQRQRPGGVDPGRQRRAATGRDVAQASRPRPRCSRWAARRPRLPGHDTATRATRSRRW